MNNYEILSYESVAKSLNNRVYTNYYYRLMLIAKSLFKWDNLPNGINEKWIERFLYSEGGCIFFKDPTYGYMITKFATSGKLNYYDEPTTVRAYATDYISTEHENNIDCVIIRNNDDMIPTFPTIQLYAHDLTNIKRTIDTNITAMKIPFIITCSDKQRLSFKQVMKQKNDNEPVIYGDKNLDTTEIKVLKTDTPIVFDKLQIQKNNVWNECMTFLGINNANTDKRERLVDDEVQANNQLIQVNSDVMLKAREEACKRINDMFGLKISVRRRTPLEMADMHLFDDVDIHEDKEDDIK
jgi:hypothetical protein